MAKLSEIGARVSTKKHLVVVCEASLSRMLLHARKPFAILTAYRGNLPKDVNIIRNRQMRTKLNAAKLGVHQLVGHYRERIDQSIPYDESDESNLRDVVERSYFVSKPERMPQDEFEQFILDLASQYDQDSVILSDGNTIWIKYLGGEIIPLGSRISLNKLGQAYSQHVRKLNVPFIFEGFETPVSNIGRLAFQKMGLLFPAANEPTKDLLVDEILW